MKPSMKWLFLLFGALLLANAAEVSASWNQDAATRADSSSTADQRMTACTRAITSGQLSAKELANAYHNRGHAFQSKKDYDRAIADYSEAIRLDPQYANAYENRGNTLFCKGEFSSAASDLAQSQQLKPHPYTAIWLYLVRMRGNSDGKTELTSNSKALDGKKWPAPVVALYLDKADSNTVISQTADPDAKKHKEQLCEANFYVGECYLLRKEKQKARSFFTKAQKDCPKDFIEYTGAVSELQRLK